MTGDGVPVNLNLITSSTPFGDAGRTSASSTLTPADVNGFDVGLVMRSTGDWSLGSTMNFRVTTDCQRATGDGHLSGVPGRASMPRIVVLSDTTAISNVKAISGSPGGSDCGSSTSTCPSRPLPDSSSGFIGGAELPAPCAAPLRE